MGPKVTQLWQQLDAIEKQLCLHDHERHEDSEQHRVFCDERFCVERGPIVDDELKAA